MIDSIVIKLYWCKVMQIKKKKKSSNGIISLLLPASFQLSDSSV